MSSITTNYNFITNSSNNTPTVKELGVYLNKKNNLSFNITGYTNTTKSIQYQSSSVISQNNINMNVEGICSNTGEIYTFGKSIAPMWVAGGNSGNTLAYSTDGITFIGLGATIFTGGGNRNAWNGYRWVAGGSGGNTLAYSNDGINWIGLGVTVFTSTCFCIAWSPLKNIWVAGGTAGNSIAYSYDGINWTGVSGSVTNMTTGRFNFWNGTRFITTGTGTNNFAMSFDGITWTYANITTFTDIISIAYSGSMWVLGGGASSASTVGLLYAYDSSLGNTAATCITQFVNINTPTGLFQTKCYTTQLCWNGKIFVALNDGSGNGIGNTIAYSYNGINWTGLGTSIFNKSGGQGLVWDGTKFIGGGQSSSANTLTYSYDGINWIGMGNTIFSSNCYGIAYNGARPHKLIIPPNRTVMALVEQLGSTTTTGKIYSNNNSLTWYSDITYNNTGGGNIWFNTIAWNGFIWVVGKYYNNTSTTFDGVDFQYSYDGITWYKSNSTNTKIFVNIFKIIWSQTLQMWIAFGADSSASNNKTTVYSFDGINWVQFTISIFTTGISSITYNEKLKIWAAVGSGGNSIGYSYDGFNWTGIGTTLCASPGTLSNNGLMFVGTGDTSNNRIIYSYDGINWKGLGSSILGNPITLPITNSFDNIIWCSYLQRWLFVNTQSSANMICYSTDGINWTGAGNSISTYSSSSALNVIFWDKSKLIMYPNQANYTSLYTSPNGNTGTWSALSITIPGDGTSKYMAGSVSTNSENCVVKIQHPTIAVGRSTAGSYNTIAYSPDGIIWYGLGNIIFSAAGYAVAWNGTMWIAVGAGTGNTVAYSIDGVSWTGLGTTIFATAGWCVAWNGTLWVAGGEGTGNTLAYSSNGLSWTGAGSSVFTTRCRGVAYYQGTTATNKWMAVGVGGNTIASSTNGTTWTGLGATTFSVGGYGITCNPYNWFAVGEGTGNTIAYSTDNGVTWTGNGKTVFTTAGYGVAWNGPLQACVAVGYSGGTSGNTIAYSTDFGVTWTGKGSSVFTSAGYGVAYNGLYFVASGAGGNTFAWSYDGNNNWTGAKGTNSSTVFDMSGCGIACNYVGTNTFQAQLSMNSSSYVGQEDKQILDVVSPPYYGQGYSSMNVSVASSLTS